MVATGSQVGDVYSGISNSLTAARDGENFDKIIDLRDNENNNDNVIDIAFSPDEVDLMELEEESWSCIRCTFLNHPALRVCECCSFERALESSKYLCHLSCFSSVTVLHSSGKLGESIGNTGSRH